MIKIVREFPSRVDLLYPTAPVSLLSDMGRFDTFILDWFVCLCIHSPKLSSLKFWPLRYPDASFFAGFDFEVDFRFIPASFRTGTTSALGGEHRATPTADRSRRRAWTAQHVASSYRIEKQNWVEWQQILRSDLWLAGYDLGLKVLQESTEFCRR